MYGKTANENQGRLKGIVAKIDEPGTPLKTRGHMPNLCRLLVTNTSFVHCAVNYKVIL